MCSGYVSNDITDNLLNICYYFIFKQWRNASPNGYVNTFTPLNGHFNFNFSFLIHLCIIIANNYSTQLFLTIFSVKKSDFQLRDFRQSRRPIVKLILGNAYYEQRRQNLLEILLVTQIAWGHKYIERYQKPGCFWHTL